MYEVAVAFLECPTLAKEAARFLIVQQNRVQNVFQFTVWDFDDPEAKRASLEPVDMDEYLERAKSRVKARGFRVTRQDTQPPKDGSPAKWLIVTEVPFDNHYYLHGDYQIVEVASLADWKEWLSPPSLLEFLLAMCQRACIDAATDMHSHAEFRGCLLDFNKQLVDTRYMVLTHTLCASCRAELLRRTGPRTTRAILRLLDWSWLGKLSEPASVVTLLKKVFAFDIFIAKKLSPTFVERLRTRAEAKTIDWAVTALIGAIAFFAGSYLHLPLGGR